ncbi:MAG: hypothetical protein WD381_00945 [Balneolaceae bacterium]
MKRKTVKRVFLFFIIYLPIQYGLVGIVGYYHSEPWPSFVFPGFKNVYVYDGGYEIQQIEFELTDSAGDEVAELSSNEFFSEIPRSMTSGFISARFSDQKMIESYDENTRIWMLEKASNIAGFDIDKLAVHHFVEYYSGDGYLSLEPDSVITINHFIIADNRDDEH